MAGVGALIQLTCEQLEAPGIGKSREIKQAESAYSSQEKTKLSL